MEQFLTELLPFIKGAFWLYLGLTALGLLAALVFFFLFWLPSWRDITRSHHEHERRVDDALWGSRVTEARLSSRRRRR